MRRGRLQLQPPSCPDWRIKYSKKADSRSRAATDGSNKEVVDCILAEAHHAADEIHDPRAARIVERTRRPIPERNEIRERMTRWQRRIDCSQIQQARKLVAVRQPPVARYSAVRQTALPTIETIDVRQSISPSSPPEAIGILQPDQPRKIVGDGPVIVVGEPWIRPCNTFLQRPVVSWRVTAPSWAPEQRTQIPARSRAQPPEW